MDRARLLVSLLALGVGATGVSCKKTPDDALVVFSVRVSSAVPTLTAIDFTVDQRPDLKGSNVTGDAAHRSFVFGYYLPGVSGSVTIVGEAVDAHGCTLGRGTLLVTGLQAGQTTTVDPSMPMTINPASGGCDGGVATRDGSSDTARTDGGGRRDATPPTDGGRSGDGPATKLQLGAPCGTGADCTSTFCVDGVCCESTCTGSCQACAETGSPGRCVGVMGTPRPNHAPCAGAGTPCVGTCDGASLMVCSYPGTSQTCSPASCTAGTATLAADCDGKGGCPTAQTVSCAPNSCSGTICTGGCSSTQPCTGATYCAGGVCKPTKASGQTCMAASECTSGFCADGTCCNSACTGSCMACNLTASPGTCSAVKSANDDTCNGTQSCDATGACKKANGQKCTAASDCTSGACVDGQCCGSASCPSCQVCTGGGGTCVAVISADDPDNCNGTSSCDATGACKLKAGQSCSTASQCVSGFCADNVCCNAACTGECEACAESASAGTCVPVSGSPRTGHGTCAGGGTACAGSCGGTNRTACSYPGTSVSCRSASCTSGTATLAANCDGNGGCPTVQTLSCAPNTCAGTVCAGGCSVSQPCAGSNYCSSAGTCVPLQANGSGCTSGTQCTSGSCVDGTCCSAASCGICQTCATANGTCAAVTNADDPNSCSGSQTCDATGTCKTKSGQTCSAGTQCLTGFCVDTVCCNSACSGTCQYCDGIAASSTPAGSCGYVSGTPKHGSCTGTGSCQGSCNGAQATCVMPGSSVMCGSASCNTSSDMSTAASFCDGSGNCPAGTTGACSPFLCGGSACLTACSGSGTNQCVSGAACIGGSCQNCSGGRTACGNVCADLTSDPNNCGSCATGCSGTKPLCVSKKCVQCGVLADCHAGYLACANNTCACRQKSANNILQNTGFDTNVNGFTSAQGTAAWSPSDSDGCPGSGSLVAPNDTIIACFPNVAPNTTYFFGFRYTQDTGGAVDCVLNWTTDSACTNGLSRFFVSTGADPTTAWTAAEGYGTSDPGTISALLRCSLNGNVNLDQFYLNPVSGSF